MKIAVDVLSIRKDGSAGGASGFALELIKGFASRQGIQVVVLCADWNIELLKDVLPENVQFCQVIGERKITGVSRIDRRINGLFRTVRSGNLLLKQDVDILFCPFSAVTFAEKGIPTVSTILDIQHEFYPQFFAPQELQHRRSFYRDIVKKAECITCISDYTKKTFCDKYQYPEERAKTIYIAIQNRFNGEDESVLDKLGIREQAYIVYPANFWEHKNHKMLLNAFAMYAYEHRDLKLVLTGNPLEQSDYYNDLIKALNIDDLTVITGYVSSEELYSILKNAKGLIYPSLFEGFGIPVVEAMQLNKLIACSDLTSLPEIGCEAIHYFNPKKADEIVGGISFLAESEMSDEIIREYQNKLKDYENDKMIDEYLNLFKNVLSQAAEYVFREEISGIYPDGWSMKEIVIAQVNEQGGRVIARLSLPRFVHRRVNVIVNHNGEERKMTLWPGKCILIEEDIIREEDQLSITFSKTWSPQKALRNDDAREIGAMVECLTFINKNGQEIDLRSTV